MLTHLVDVSIRSLLLTLVAAIVLGVLRRRRTAAWQHAVWTGVICGMLALFAFGQFLPRLSLLVPDRVTAPVLIASPLPAYESPVPPQWQPPIPAKPGRSITWLDVVAYAYGAITCLFLARFALGLFLVARIHGRCTSRSVPPSHGLRVTVFESEALTVPATVGCLRPRILLPMEWREWDQDKLTAVLTHESAHIHRRDNLTVALAALNRCIFWFHPLAWFLEHQLALLAEQACDESCVATLGDRHRYAHLLLEMASTVDHSLGRLRCHALTMAAPSHLRRRIDSLLQEGRTFSRGLTWAGWAALTLCGIPLVFGAGAVDLDRPPAPLTLELPKWHIPAPTLMKQTLPAPKPVLSAQARPAPPPPPAAPKFDVASIKQCAPSAGRGGRGGRGAQSPGRFSQNCVSVAALIWRAYSDRQVLLPSSVAIEKAPGWVNSDHYTVEATAEGNPSQATMRAMLQTLLAERFQLKMHRENREVPVYALTVAKAGLKLPPSPEGSCVPVGAEPPTADTQPCGRPKRGIAAFGPNDSVPMIGETMADLAILFSGPDTSDRPVIDKTGLTGMFDIQLPPMSQYGLRRYADAAPKAEAEASGVSPFPPTLDTLRPILQKWGLSLDPAKAPSDFFVIDRVERPTDN